MGQIRGGECGGKGGGLAFVDICEPLEKSKKTAGLPQRLEFWEETSKKAEKGVRGLSFAALQ
jgi:hypothetical protein